ncbi:MAG: division/cell wall cluster transcriptional repressor MraZ [Hornefia sp.]|nr:division/cell wall cluster transcriptional repressor MraZ [Hornefia sp.]
MFMGTYYNSIDSKNRLIVPSKHRDQLGGRCVLTKGLDLCLYIYSMDEWGKLTEKISQLPESDPKVRKYIREHYANAMECEFDKQGRIVIPQQLKDYAHIEKDLVTMGAMKKIEIWSKDVWDAPSEDDEDFSDALAKYNF